MNEQDLIKAFKAFQDSAFALSEAIDKYNDSHEDLFCACSEDYPFAISFDEVIFDIATWVGTQAEILTSKGE